MAGTKRSIEPSAPHERRGRERLDLRGELALAFFPTVTILLVLWTLEILADQRVLFAALASSAFLIYLDPLHGTNTMRALSISHAGAALAGIAVAAVLGYGYAASAVAMVLTILLMVVVDVVHPPAIGTSLTFAYRSGSATNLQLFLVALGMVLLLAGLQRVVQYLLSRLTSNDGRAEG